MAPKRRNSAALPSSRKGSAAPVGGKGNPAHLNKREQQEAEWRSSTPFFPEGLSEEGVAKLSGIAAMAQNKHGGTRILHAASWSGDRLPRDVRVFSCFLVAGINPPLSPFLRAILVSYGLQLAHLHPNAVMALAIFQFLCEGFVGVMPSVLLFRHYFVPRIELGDAISGGVTFRLWDRLTDSYISVEKKKWDEWQGAWCFARFPSWVDALAEPSSPPSRRLGWGNQEEEDEGLALVYARISDQRTRGLTGRHVVQEYISQCIAPLQERSHPAWEFCGPLDRTRLFVGPSSGTDHMVRAAVNWLLGDRSDLSPLPPSVFPLYHDKENMDSVLASMPQCDELGVRRVWRSVPEFAEYRRRKQLAADGSPGTRSLSLPNTDDGPSRCWRWTPLSAGDRLSTPASRSTSPSPASVDEALDAGAVAC